jgi:archaellum component FlaG (FlaF/FlaG flagellin family)
MSDEDDTSLLSRRWFLRGTATAGSASLAGCSSLLGDESTPTDTETPRLSDSPSPTDTAAPMIQDTPRAKGPLGSRPESPDEDGFEYLVDRGKLEGALFVWQGDEWKLLDAYADGARFADLAGRRVASAYATSGSGTVDDPWILDDSAMQTPGVLWMDEGEFRSDGLTTSSDIDYEETNIWLRGAGTRATSLTKGSEDGHLVAFDDDGESGNFGGVTDMAVYGEYPEDGTRSEGHLVYSNGDVFDLTLENLIVRYGWEDAIHIAPSASGTRLHNLWAENSGGWAVWVDGGTRAKASDLHIVNCKDGGLHFEVSSSHVEGVSVYLCWPGMEFACRYTEVSDGYIVKTLEGVALHDADASRENKFTNFSIVNSKTAVQAAGTDSMFTNFGVRDTREQAFRVSADGVQINGLDVINFGKAGTAALRLAGDNAYVANVTLDQRDDGYDSTTIARIEGDRTVLNGVVGHGNREWSIEVANGATETVLANVAGVARSAVTDRGTRTLFNGEGTNGGDPAAGGEWNGHGDYAHDMGAVVWDTSTSPWTPYRADGDGNWLSLR